MISKQTVCGVCEREGGREGEGREREGGERGGGEREKLDTHMYGLVQGGLTWQLGVLSLVYPVVHPTGRLNSPCGGRQEEASV